MAVLTQMESMGLSQSGWTPLWMISFRKAQGKFQRRTGKLHGTRRVDGSGGFTCAAHVLKSNILHQTTFYNSFSSSYWNRTADICSIRIRKHDWKVKAGARQPPSVQTYRDQADASGKMFSQRSEANRTTVGINGGRIRIQTQNLHAKWCRKRHDHGPNTRDKQTRTSDRFGGGTQAKRKSRTNARDKNTSKAYAFMALTLSRNNGMSCLNKVLTSVSYPTPPHTPSMTFNICIAPKQEMTRLGSQRKTSQGVPNTCPAKTQLNNLALTSIPPSLPPTPPHKPRKQQLN